MQCRFTRKLLLSPSLPGWQGPEPWAHGNHSAGGLAPFSSARGWQATELPSARERPPHISPAAPPLGAALAPAAAGARRAGHTECHPLTPPPPSHSPWGHSRRALRPMTGYPGWRFGAGQPFPPHPEPGAARTRGSISPPGCRAAYPHGCAHCTRVCRKLWAPSLLQGVQAPTAAAHVAQGWHGGAPQPLAIPPEPACPPAFPPQRRV